MRRSPQRSCIGCRTVREKRELVRVVRTLDGRFLLDPGGKLPGRGAYVCPSAACVELAVKRKAFERALRAPVPREDAAALSASIIDYLRAREGSLAAAPERRQSAGGRGSDREDRVRAETEMEL